MKTAVNFLLKYIEPSLTDEQKHFFSIVIEKAKEMEKQMVIDIVEKSRATGLTAEYLLLTYGSKGSDETLKENHIVDTNEMVSSQIERMYSEEDLREALSESFKASQEGYQITSDEIISSLTKSDSTSSQTEISDEMIKEVELRYCSNIEQQIGWYKAIEWYREQLKKKQL